MKRWLGWALSGLGVCLLLALGRPEAGRGVESRPCVAAWGRSVGVWEEPSLAPPTTAPAAWKARPRQAHTTPSESRAIHLALLTEGDVGPPWLDSRGPPGKVHGTWVDSRAADQIGSPQSEGSLCFPYNCQAPPSRQPPQERGFATGFS